MTHKCTESRNHTDGFWQHLSVWVYCTPPQRTEQVRCISLHCTHALYTALYFGTVMHTNCTLVHVNACIHTAACAWRDLESEVCSIINNNNILPAINYTNRMPDKTKIQSSNTYMNCLQVKWFIQNSVQPVFWFYHTQTGRWHHYFLVRPFSFLFYCLKVGDTKSCKTKQGNRNLWIRLAGQNSSASFRAHSHITWWMVFFLNWMNTSHC